MKRYILLLIAIFGLFAVQVAADDVIEGRTGRAEVRFLEGMIDHHIMALMMAYDALDKASTEELRVIAQNVIDAQSAEIAQMQGWLRDWYSIEYLGMTDFSSMSPEDRETATRGMMDNMMAVGGMSEHAGHNMGGMRSSDMPMMMGMMAGFGVFEGETYDIAWLESMIDHHDDAIHMSERLLERAPEGHPELLTLAQAIIDAQSAEITEMETLISTLEAQ